MDRRASRVTFGRIVFLLAASVPALAHAQAGPCGDPWINQAFHQMYGRAPIGSGKNVGECDITRYGNGHWSTYQDLTTKIAQHQASTTSISRVASSSPSVLGGSSAFGNANSLVRTNGSGIVAAGGGNVGQQAGANIINQDGNGFRTLSVDKPRASPGKYLVIPGGNLVDANGNVVRQSGTYTLVARSGGYAVGTGAGARAPSPGTVVTP